MNKPLVIALEGIPGSGKTTLKNTINLNDLRVERVEQILPDDPQSDDGLGLKEVMISDFLKTNRVINNKADVVILDRYYLSTLAYQASFDKIYGLEHLAIFILNKFGKATERKVVYLIHAFQILFILIAFLMI
jgi:thymidylate kinase